MRACSQVTASHFFFLPLCPPLSRCCLLFVQLKEETQIGINMITALRSVFSAMFKQADRASIGPIASATQPSATPTDSKQTYSKRP